MTHTPDQPVTPPSADAVAPSAPTPPVPAPPPSDDAVAPSQSEAAPGPVLPPSDAVPAPSAPVPPPPSSTPGVGLAQVPAVWLGTLRDLYARKPERAVDGALSSEQRTGNAHALWAFTALVSGLLTGLTLVVMLARVSSALGIFSTVDFGDYLSAIVLPPILLAVSLVARAGALMAVGATGQRQVRFKDALNLVAVSYIALVPAGALALVLAGAESTFTSFLVGVTALFAGVVGELTLFTELTRRHEFEKSPILAYAGFMTLWVVVMGSVVALALADALAASAFG